MNPPKPHRVLLDRFSSYADEAAAYMRRRRVSRRAFWADGVSESAAVSFATALIHSGRSAGNPNAVTPPIS